ncbi:alpha/beta hydrolase [Glutamicibacter sp. 287]|uniref:alpha/beta hydrolase n=1 Tax=unclassified Glutamicibacter TaxID=2627139 RepID=UPI00159660C5|nr:alpha/beta hydrolase [Glutamicibacter sp. BW80]
MKVSSNLPSGQWPDFTTTTNPGQWVADPLGEGFEYTTLDFGTDSEGPAVGTLVRYKPAGWRNRLPRKFNGVVLSVHGWSDYFFNRELAEFWHQRGYHFYALDLRRYGRSLRAEHEIPGFVDDLAVYDQELEAAMDLLGTAHPDLPIIGQGHSQGGLILSLWVARTGPRIQALVLNAPWLEFQGTAFLRVPMHGILEAIGRTNGRRKLALPEFDHYWNSLSDQGVGEWDIHRLWRPRLAFQPTTAWMKTILDGHATVAKGLNLTQPIFVISSDASHFSTSYSPAMQSTDSVIDIHQIRLRALKLGSFVTLAQIHGAMHDVFTSAEPARAAAYRDLALWLRLLDRPR